MPAPVVVEVSAPQPSAQELAVLIAACTRAAAPNECITTEAKGNETPLGVAIVRRDGDKARIELGLRGGPNAEWSTRDLTFQPGDDELERYRAIGFAIGTLVARQVLPAPPAPAPAPTPAPNAMPTSSEAAPPDEPEAAATSAPRETRGTWLDLQGSVGLGLIPGSPRVGGALRAATELSPRGFFAVAQTSFAARPSDPQLRVRWLGAAIGIGHPLAPGLQSLGIDARLQLAIERLSMTATSAGKSEGTARWKPGAIAGLDVHWDMALPVSLLASAETFIDPERTVVRIGGEQVGETPALGLSGFFGVRLRLR